MNKTDAAAILNIDPSASPEEARRAYQELFTEHQVRLTNAPTPALRSLYQARILELDDAKDAFMATSLGDADSDLPTDQPSIPSQASAPPPPPPPPPRPSPRGASASEARGPSSAPPSSAAPAPEPAKSQPAPERSTASETKKKSPMGAILGGIAAIAVIGFIAVKMMGGGSGAQQEKVTPAVAPSYADSIPPLRENITVARVEFGRGDYDAANAALTEANRHYSVLPAAAAADTAVIHLKLQVDSLHAKVVRACDALKKVAERHPGERTCKSL